MRSTTAFFIFFTIFAQAQVRISKLIIPANETFELNESDIIVTDTLIMMDSSRIKLNSLRPENFIRAKVAIFGQHCIISGRGINGKRGRNGNPGITPTAPCLDGTNGRNGSRGLDGIQGVNLFLYLDKIVIKGNLICDLSAGNGGNGGNGGEGGSGGPGTKQCYGGNGGNGGSGGGGANGGLGGTLIVGGGATEIVKSLLGNFFVVKQKGGSFGYGGISGYGGAAGLSSSGKNGKAGFSGNDGPYGKPGNNGTVKFEE
jgi:hypothetical protein